MKTMEWKQVEWDLIQNSLSSLESFWKLYEEGKKDTGVSKEFTRLGLAFLKGNYDDILGQEPLNKLALDICRSFQG